MSKVIFKNLCLSLLQPPGKNKPPTPVRWLCLKALAYIAYSEKRELPTETLDALVGALELGVMINRFYDGKRRLPVERYRYLREKLPPEHTSKYLGTIRGLERSRPQSDDWPAVYQYRRDVLEESLSYLAQLAGVRSRKVLLSLCSLIQLVDDVLDRNTDRTLALPTFLSEGAPSPEQLARNFWEELKGSSEERDSPFLWSGYVLYIFTRATIAVSHLWP